MNALLFSLLAACCASLSSLLFRKNADSSCEAKNPGGFLVLYFLSSLTFTFLFYPDLWKFEISYTALLIGAIIGGFNSILMVLTAKALKYGPAGLTYAFLNASAIFPGVILFLLLGTDFGFSFSFLQFIGMSFVLVGLFIGAKKQSNNGSQDSTMWLKFTLGCFMMQVLALTLIQSRCILFNCSGTSSFLAHLSISESDDMWVMPGQFATSLIIHTLLFFRENRKLRKDEFIFGSLGGVANFSSTCLLFLATKYALSFEKVILFPLFAVATMILCSIWAKLLYQERFNFRTNALCSFGIFMAVFK